MTPFLTMALVGQRRGRGPTSSSYGLANTYPPLPQSVYDDWADDEVSVINMPAGDWYLDGVLWLNRSDVTVNFAGCRLHIDPADGANGGWYPIQVASTPVVTPTYLPSPDGIGPATRYISRASGAISTGTTTLTMDEDEVVDLQVGETVLIWAGVTPSDPVEAQAYIPAIVSSVDVGTRVITFTAGLGKNITNYGSLEGLEAATDAGLHWKIGAWGTYPDAANFSKGYGIDHGIERFVGGMVSNVTLNGPRLYLDPITDAEEMPNAMWVVSAVATNGVTINDLFINNPHGLATHFFRAFNTLVDGYTLTGAGSAQVWNSDISEAIAVGMWGGDGSIFRNLSITGTDITVTYVEVGATGIWFDGLVYDVTFTALRNYSNQPTVIYFYNVGDGPFVTNASIRAVTTGGSLHEYFGFAGLTLDGSTVFPGTSPTAFFDWGAYRVIALDGTVTINGVTYGPAITDTIDFTVLHGADNRLFTPPAGLYTSITMQFISNGDVYVVQDIFDNDYSAALVGGAPIELVSDWYLIGAGAGPLASYLAKYVIFYLNNGGSTADATVRFQVTYLPAN